MSLATANRLLSMLSRHIGEGFGNRTANAAGSARDNDRLPIETDQHYFRSSNAVSRRRIIVSVDTTAAAIK